MKRKTGEPENRGTGKPGNRKTGEPENRGTGEPGNSLYCLTSLSADKQRGGNSLV